MVGYAHASGPSSHTMRGPTFEKSELQVCVNGGSHTWGAIETEAFWRFGSLTPPLTHPSAPSIGCTSNLFVGGVSFGLKSGKTHRKIASARTAFNEEAAGVEGEGGGLRRPRKGSEDRGAGGSGRRQEPNAALIRRQGNMGGCLIKGVGGIR